MTKRWSRRDLIRYTRRKRRGARGHRSATVVCPECGEKRPIYWNPRLRRFKPRTYACRARDCDFVGHRGEWDSEQP